MDIAGKYDVYFGTERGVLGNTQCKPGQPPTYDIKNTSKDAEITSMEWGRSNEEIIIGQKNGIVRLYNTKQSTFFAKISDDALEGRGPIVGAEALIDKLVVARRSGDIGIWNDEIIDNFKINTDGTVDCMKHNVNRKNIIGTGGEKNDFKLWDIERKECIFKAKSMGHDNLNLPIPTTIRAITFFESDNKLNACCTREGHILLYDERAQRRPVTKINVPNCNFTTISSHYNNKRFAVGTSVGKLQIFDFANPKHPVKSFPKFSGGVSSVVWPPFTSYIFSVSFDRYLRVHNIETAKLTYSEYLKQALTKVLVKPTASYVDVNSDDEDKEDITVNEEYDDLFDNMEIITEGKKKKTKNGSNKETKRKKTM